MDKFITRTNRRPQPREQLGGQSCEFSPNEEVDWNNLPTDPGERKKLTEYHPGIQDEVRRKYIQMGLVQPKNHKFPFKLIGGKSRRFSAEWFDKHENWLEYSKKKDALFCLPCYLFKPDCVRGGDAFVGEGFSYWNKKQRLNEHVGEVNSAHNLAVERYENLKDEKNSIQTVFQEFSEQDKKDYKTRLEASVICCRYLLRMRLPFRGHNESEESNNRGNYIELLKVAGYLSKDIEKVMLKSGSGNLQLIAPSIQREIVNCAAKETLKVIFEELGDDLFGLLVDESSDVSYKEQMAIVLRYLNKQGIVLERFIGVVHVNNTSALSLKSAIDSFFDEFKLSMSSIRGQGYDGASNMRGEFGGLKTLIQSDNSSAYYTHCFAHQLQLTLVATAKGHLDVVWFFDLVSDVVNVIGSSCKRRDVFRELRGIRIAAAISNGDIETGKGLNQERGIKRPGDTRWGSHYRSLVNLQESFLDVLDFIYNDVTNSSHKKNARGLMAFLRSFDFIFILHLMVDVLGITNGLSVALQREDQDIENAMHLVNVCKQRLQAMREEDTEWDDLLEKVHQVCYNCDVEVVDMNDIYVSPGRPKRRAVQNTNLHHYRVDVFCAVIDLQLQELNDRFDKVNTELLLCIACLSPKDNFHVFNLSKLQEMASFYPYDFDDVLVRVLSSELKNYIVDVRSHAAFIGLKSLGDLARVMVETRKNVIYPHVFLLLKLALILPVSTASVERAFSAMKYVKTKLRNRMCDDFLNDCLVTYVERDICESVSNDDIIYRFQNMKSRRGCLV